MNSHFLCLANKDESMNNRSMLPLLNQQEFISGHSINGQHVQPPRFQIIANSSLLPTPT